MAKGETYEEFIDKFKPKLTTDDCYTPTVVYETVCDWACKEYAIDPQKIVRPFYPGGDYEKFDYPPGCVVLDNPPFSILAKIIDFYLSRKIPFFLFAPALTAFTGKHCCEVNHIFCNAEIIYENGAVVKTAFITSFGDEVARVAVDLKRSLAKVQKSDFPSLPKYEYPDHIVTAAMMQKFALREIDFRVKKGECVKISRLDSQIAKGKGIFGSGLLIADKAAADKAAADKAAADKAAADKAAAVVWKLSEREERIVHELQSSR